MQLRSLLIVLSLLTASGCAVETIVHGLDEREANRIVELLADNEIEALKQVVEGREINFSIAVPAKTRVEAIRLLNYYELPRRRDRGYNDVFQASGLIPTSAEEKAKKLSALEGEIERQLKIIDGIIDVQVQLVLPEENALRTTQDQQTPTTASCTVKYLPGAGGTKPLSEPQVQAIVAGGAEGLTPENVVVVMTPATKSFAPRPGTEATAAPANSADRKRYNLLLAGLLILTVLMGLGLLYSQTSLTRVRGRLIRLQDQIQKARKKQPGEVTSSDQSPAA